MNKTEEAYGSIRGRIVAGAFAPGQRLVVASLAKELGVSSVPIREALRRLEAEGWLTIRPNVGAEVRSVNTREWVDVMNTLALLEGQATATAAAHLTVEDLRRARDRNDGMRNAFSRMDPVAASDCSRAFHTILVERCPNAYLRHLTHQAAERLDAMQRTVFVFTAMPQRTHATVDEHEHLISLIERGADVDAIEHHSRQHKLETVRAYQARDNSLPAVS